jgi:hypothetical protein
MPIIRQSKSRPTIISQAGQHACAGTDLDYILSLNEIDPLPSFDEDVVLTVDRTQGPGSILPEGTCHVIEERALHESWTGKDIQLATMQALLLSYVSTPRAAHQYGVRYVDSAPQDYRHNCPWNDWVPPSKTGLWTPLPRAVLDRVRVIMCTSPRHIPVDFNFSLATRPENTASRSFVIAFASVDESSDGSRVLCLRRGSDILASLCLSKLCCKFSKHSVWLSSKVTQPIRMPKVCLRFDTESRRSKFEAMVLDAPTRAV